MNADELTALVRQVVTEVVKATEKASPETPGDTSEAPLWSRGPKHRKLPEAQNPTAIEAMKASTPARIITGRTGTRYLTESYLGLRADHAIAIDAVESEIKDGWAEAQGWLPLKTRCATHQEFLLQPDHGRSLDDASKARCSKEAEQGVDIQLIAGDGLSATALMTNGPELIKALTATLTSAGFKVGKPLFVKFARIGVQDEIGVLTKAKCTVIIVGERPGLGTGDSLSIYTAYAPRLSQDNSEKDCISNVRAVGFVPARAAVKCADLLKATFAAKGGGMKLTGDTPSLQRK